jgi:hypothetical protein
MKVVEWPAKPFRGTTKDIYVLSANTIAQDTCCP